MKIGIINLSTDPSITPALLEEIAAALEEQSFIDVASYRQTGGVTCRYYMGATGSVDPNTGAVVTSGMPAGTCPHFVYDYPDNAGELGDHFVTGDGLPVLRSFWGPTRDNGGTLLESLSVTMSHEHIEASENPYTNGWRDLPDGVTEEADEACDRVEGSSYVMNGTRVTVSNFLTPRAFRDGPGPYDRMSVLSTPFELPSDGYHIIRTGGPAGNTQAVFGEKYPAWKRALKMLPGSRANRRGCIWTIGVP